MRLTDQHIRGIPFLQSGQRDYADEAFSGLALRVGKRTKTFMYLAGKGANRQRHTLGRYDPPRFTLAMAREKARELMGSHRSLTQVSIFKKALDTFFATHHRKNRLVSVRERRRLFNRHFSVLFARRLDSIKTGELVTIFDGILHTPAEANHAYSAINTFFTWAVKRRLIERSPEGLDRPAPIKSRSRVLTPAELAEVWRVSFRFPHYGPFVRCLLLTGQRRGQFSKLTADLVAWEKQTIKWPADMMKGRREHTIPFGPLVAQILAEHPNGFRTARGIMFTMTGTAKSTFDRHCSVKDWTLHDLRRTWATISAEELDTPPHIIEAVLAHQSGTAVARTYNRAKYIEPMRKALIGFEEWLHTLVSTPENENG